MILVIDNYDSFTYNLVQILRGYRSQESQRSQQSQQGYQSQQSQQSQQGYRSQEVRVVRNDALSLGEIEELSPKGIVLSPGPGRPEKAGVCVELLELRLPIPTLGVCLGHQALGVAFGARVEAAPKLMHGKTSAIRHNSEGLFSGIESPLEATRYHSLTVPEESLPDDLEAIAWADDGTLQAMRHRELPFWGVQFHPESILTPHGPALVRNFLELCA